MATIVTRSDKGSPLSYTEMDNNFINLNTDKVETSNPQTTGSLQHNGNVNLTGTSARITGDFSNATNANRVMFQTSTVNGSTVVSTLPNGSSTKSGFRAYGSDNLVNGISGDLIASIALGDVRLVSNAYGEGAYLPMTFHTGGSERMRIDTSGNVLVDGNNLKLFSAKSLAENGYQKLPSGLIVQWGYASVPAASSLTVSLPIAFPNAFLQGVVAASGTPASSASYGISPSSLTQVTVFNSNLTFSQGTRWIAIGY